MRRRPLLLLLLVTALLAGCAPAAHGPRVVVGAYPFEWLVRQLVGPHVTVVDLVKPGVEPHDIELTPRQVADAQGAVVLRLGGFQPAVDHLGGTDLAQAPGLDQMKDGGVADPHVWLDPVRMKVLAAYVDHVLTERLPGYRSGRLAALDATLDALDADLRRRLTGCRSREIVTSHAAFAYFAQRYGLTQRGIAGLSPDAEPSPERLAEVASYARAHHVTTIFFESLVSPKVAQTVAAEIGAHTAVLDPIEGVRGSDDYLTVMRRNAATLHTALGCR